MMFWSASLWALKWEDNEVKTYLQVSYTVRLTTEWQKEHKQEEGEDKMNISEESHRQHEWDDDVDDVKKGRRVEVKDHLKYEGACWVNEPVMAALRVIHLTEHSR